MRRKFKPYYDGMNYWDFIDKTEEGNNFVHKQCGFLNPCFIDYYYNSLLNEFGHEKVTKFIYEGMKAKKGTPLYEAYEAFTEHIFYFNEDGETTLQELMENLSDTLREYFDNEEETAL